MNWLAHVFLSDPHVEHRLGNLLADLVRGAERAAMSAEFRRGADRHRAIDAYTDAHPIVKRSRARLGPEHRRFSGVLVDVFYDYFLASRWSRYSNGALDDFTRSFYADAMQSGVVLPERAYITLERIIRYDLLGAYRNIEGVEQSLRRLSLWLGRRWRRDFALERATAVLRANEGELWDDFREYFPELQAHVARLGAPAARR